MIRLALAGDHPVVLRLLFALALAGGSPQPTSQDPGARIIEAQGEAPVAAAPALEGPAAPPPAPLQRASETRRKPKPKRLLIAGAVTYTAGAALTWAAMSHDLRPGPRRQPERPVARTMGLVFGGSAMFEGTLLTGLAAHAYGKSAPDDRRKSRALRAGGATLFAVGGVGLASSAVFLPRMRQTCPAGAACGLAAMQVSGAAMTAGAGMLGYGSAIRPYEDRERRRLPKRVQTPLIAGACLLGSGYFTALIMGTAIGTNDDPTRRRIRNRMYIPVAGPWIVAAGPDANFFLAATSGVVGLAQIGGAVSLGVGGIMAGAHKRRGRRLTLLPTPTGATLVGQF